MIHAYCYQGTNVLAPLTTKEVSVQTGFSIRTLQRYTKEGRITKTVIKGRNYYNQDEVDRFLRETFHAKK